MSCVEIFGGMGAMSLGLTQAGFEHAILVEIDDACVTTLRKNGFVNVLHSSVAQVDFRPYSGVDLVAGGVPTV